MEKRKEKPIGINKVVACPGQSLHSVNLAHGVE